MSRPDPATENLKPANAERVHIVSASDMPLSCPTPSMQLWNSHPRVYLPIEQGGEARCPYCGTLFQWTR